MRVSSSNRASSKYWMEMEKIEDQEEAKAKMKERTWDMISLIDNGTNDFENMRVNEENLSHFCAFVDLCLIHCVTSLTWRYDSYNTPVSKIFTVSDEAFVMLLLEHNANDLKRVYQNQRKIERKDSVPKFTKVKGKSNEKFQGWHKNGLKRYNELYKIVHKNRMTDQSRKIETLMMKKYSELRGKTFNGENEDEQYDSDDSNNCNDEIFAIDGFDDYENDDQTGSTSSFSASQQTAV